jgi:hypothetical protein
MNKEWGVVDTLIVKADTFKSLVAAVTIAMTYHSVVAGWGLGFESIILYGSENPPNKFLTPYKDPEKVASVIWDWLSHTPYPSGDRDEEKGYHLELCSESTYMNTQAIFTVKPIWIYYSE